MPAEDLLERDLALHPGQCRTEAEVGAVPERQVTLGAAPDVERPGGRPVLALVVVGGPDDEQHGLACLEGFTVELDVVRQRPVHVLRRVVEAQRLLDRVGDERRIVDEERTLLGMLGQQLDRVGEQLRRRLVAGDDEQDAEAEQLLLGERSAVDLEVEQIGDEPLALIGAGACGGRRRSTARGRASPRVPRPASPCARRRGSSAGPRSGAARGGPTAGSRGSAR